MKIGRFDEDRISWSVNYLKRGPISEIERGEIVVTGYEWDGGPAILEYADQADAPKRAKTVWHRTLHDAGTYGSGLIRQVLGNRAFEFPKSLYAVRDTLSTIVGTNQNALVIDFFAGSGTTLNAINLLNAIDGGKRRCVLVTNNEVSAEEAEALRARDLQPGDEEWEAQGICRSVTWPRSKFTILGRRDDNTALSGEYLTGQIIEKEKARNFTQIGFVDPASLNTPAKKKQVVALIEANQGTTNLATFRAIAKKYPSVPPEQILRDLVASTPGSEGKWFAAAKDVGLFDVAIELATRSPTDPRTLTRAARDYAEEQPEFALSAGLAALHWISRGHGYEITGGDVFDAHNAVMHAAAYAGIATDGINAQIRAMCAAPGGRLLQTILVQHLSN